MAIFADNAVSASLSDKKMNFCLFAWACIELGDIDSSRIALFLPPTPTGRLDIEIRP